MDNKLPGLYFIETDNTGERTFYYWRNDAAARFWLTSPAADEICQRLEKFDYLYLSGISLAILDSASRQRLLQLLRDALGIDKLVAAAIERGARARHMTL